MNKLHFSIIPPKRDPQPCWNCGKNQSRDCGFLEYDEWNGDYDCGISDENLECPCKYTFCDECQAKLG